MPVLILLIVILVVAWFKVTENSFKKVRAQLVEAEKKLEDAVFSRRDALVGLRQAMGGMFPESELPAVPELSERIHVREMEAVGDGLDAMEDGLFSLLETRPGLIESPELAEPLLQVREQGLWLQRIRNYYNSGIGALNDAREELPSSIVAKVLGVSRGEYCDIRDYTPKTEGPEEEEPEETAPEDGADGAPNDAPDPREDGSTLPGGAQDPDSPDSL